MKPLCVLLHGYPNNTLIWKEQLPFLTKKFDILNLALPGSETGIVSPEDLKLKTLVARIVCEIEKTSHQEIILVGHDIGSFVLSELADLLGNKVKAQIFLAGMDFRLFRRQLHSSLQLFKSWYVLPLQIPNLPEKILPLIKKNITKRIYKNSPDLSAEAPFGFSPVAIYRNLKTGLKKTKAQKTSIPTLLLFGKGDRYILPPGMSEINRYYSKASLEVLPGGHWFMRENPAMVNQKINDFLGQNL